MENAIKGLNNKRVHGEKERLKVNKYLFLYVLHTKTLQNMHI